MQTLEQLKNRTPHDIMLEGNNASYFVAGHFPKTELEKILPKAMSIPSDEVMADKYPTLKAVEGQHPFLLMFSNCNNVHDVMTEIELRPYRELMFFIPVTYTHENEERLCSYVPVLYLEYLIGVIGGLYLGLRKEFHPGMKDIETDKSKSFIIKDVLDVSFEKTSLNSSKELDPFFAQTIDNPTVTVSYLNQTYFYTTKVHPTKVLDTTPVFEWRYKGSVIKNNADTFANYSEYHFTTSQAMRFKAYFHPTYTVAE
ncbi:MAG: hypothetical protein GY725_19745 [bacterium]|nr:hypothetical protein [bacterium]